MINMNTLTDTKTLNTEQLADVADTIGYTLEQVQDLYTSYDSYHKFFEVGNYYVFTDYDRAEAYAREMLDSLADEYFGSVDEALQTYVDSARWIDDVIRFDGVGHVIASYDGDELETQGGLFVYRVN